MKYIVETIGSIRLYMPAAELDVPHDRPAVVQATQFIQNQIAQRQLTILATLNDEATEVEFGPAYEEAALEEDFDGPDFVETYAKLYPLETKPASKDDAPVKDPPVVKDAAPPPVTK